MDSPTRCRRWPIATKTPGVQLCEQLPLLAARSDKWALVRSLTHPYNAHSQGHHVMLTGRTPYEGRDPVAVFHQHLHGPPPAILKVLPQCPIPLARVGIITERS